MKRWFLWSGIIIFFLIAGIMFFLYVLGVFDSFLGKKIGKCLILTENYCKQGKAYYTDDELTGIHYSLPKGTKVFSPVDGKFNFGVLKGVNNQNHEKAILTASDGDYWYELIFVDIKGDGSFGTKDIKKGDLIGNINSNTKEKNLLLVIKKIEKDNSGNINPVIDIDKMEEIVNLKSK